MNSRIIKAINFTSVNFEWEVIDVFEDENLKMHDVDKLLPKKVYVPQKNDRIYFMPDCDVPRFKVKSFCNKYDVALVKYSDKANVKFVSGKTYQNLLTYNSNFAYSKEGVLNWLRHYRPEYTNLRDAIIESECRYIFSRTTIQALESVYEYGAGPRIKFKNEATYSLFKVIFNDEQIYHQNSILRAINTGGVIGLKEFESIKRFFESADEENVKLAMEMMANADYEKSCVYLLLLVMQFGKVMDNTHTKKHVNFKSFIKFFEINGLHNVGLNDVVKSLMKRQLLNQFNLELLMPYVKETLRQQTGLVHFLTDTITISEEVKIALNESILNDESNVEIISDNEEQITPNLKLITND